MLPVERKNEFLRYVMITEPYDEWSDVVFEYIIENHIMNWKEGFDFVVKHSYDPSIYAYWIVEDGFVKPEWAMKVIENDTIGDPSRAAYFMVRNGHAKTKWTRKVIENATTGNSSGIAIRMVRYGYATKEWCQEIKRKFNVSN